MSVEHQRSRWWKEFRPDDALRSLTPMVIAATMAVALGNLSFLAFSAMTPLIAVAQTWERRRTTSYEDRLSDVENELAEAEQAAREEANADQLRELRERIERLQTDQQRLAPAARFAEERQQAAASSAAAFSLALVIVSIVVAVGLAEWAEIGPFSIDDGSVRVSLELPDALARVAVLTAAFYLAGQLFKRSTVQNLRAQEFRRASIAMEVTDSLADQLSSSEADKFRRTIYEHHLTGGGSAPPDDKPDTDFAALPRLIEAMTQRQK